MAMNIDILIAELADDPLGRGYAAMDDAAAAADLNIAYQSQERTVIPAHEIVDALVVAEWAAITDLQRTTIGLIVSAGSVNVQNANVRDAFLDAFVGGTTTRANLAAIQTEQVSRGVELGLGFVGMADVEDARRI